MADRPRLLRPRAYLAPDGAWPEGPFRADTPVEVDYAAAVAVAVRMALDGRGWRITDLATRADLAPSTVSRLLSGRSWPDVYTIFKLEEVLQLEVWPRSRPDAVVPRNG